MSNIVNSNNNNYSISNYKNFYNLTAKKELSTPDDAIYPKTPTNIGPNNNDPEVKLLKKIGAIDCKSCKERTYQDGSDDPGVSFKAAGHIAPEASSSVVMSHEMEHVSNERAKASSEGREVVSQNVKIFSATCPECGKAYTSGGETTTTTKGKPKNDYFMNTMKKSMEGFFGGKLDVRV